jgi:hypothetical protein
MEQVADLDEKLTHVQLQDNVADSFIWTTDQVASFTVNCSYVLLSRLATEVDTDCDFVALSNAFGKRRFHL